MTKNIYRQLQERLDLYSMGFPPTQSGIEIKILTYLFTEPDARLFLALSPALEAPDVIADRLHAPREKTAAHLEQMAKKGLLFRLKKGDTKKYGAIPFVHGLFEFQVKDLTPELAKMVGDYFDEAFDRSMQQNAAHFLRVIPVNKSIDLTHHVASYEDAVQILQSKDQIVVAECICRKRTKVMDQGCGKTLEACFMFGSMGQYYLDKQMGRKIPLEEAIEILKDCREAGLVTQPATAQNPTGMCNCCGDCCGVLGAINKHPSPASIVFSNHVVNIANQECIGCELCLERCQMDALALNEARTIEVVKNRCIGCGLCVTTCPVDALELIDKPDKDLQIPPATMGEQMMEMAKRRGVI
jgi:Pyruvate/2-oxoacid:ferredoxin oxidoreductase delta subunit